jgi:formate dehydrogenase subunit gamma
MMRLVMALLLLLPLGGAMAQQGSGSPPAGAPSVQSAAPEVGAGRGGPGNADQPATSEPATQTGGPRPAPMPRKPRVEVEPIPAPPPLTSRADTDAAALEAQHAENGGVIGGAVSIPNQSAGILIQPQGRDWRGFRERILTIAGAVILLGTVFILAGLYLLRGPQRIDAGRSGRTLHRYGAFERMNHWMVAVSFVLLGLTGINITFGRTLLRPVIGAEAFTTLTLAGQAVHQFLSFPFVVGLMAMVVVWARDNLPSRVDIAWLKAGGPVAKGHPPAGRFNAAQKALYWFVLGGGILASVSGYLLMAPGLLDNVVNQQWAHVLHGAMAMVMMAAILGHIYIGTIGTEGAFEAMATGRVDYNYAREHHSLWVEDRLAEARRTAAGAD